MKEIIGYQSYSSENSDGLFKSAFVGYLDILGFKEKVKDKTNRELLVNNYNEIYDYLKQDDPIEVPIKNGILHGFGERVGSPCYDIVTISNKHIYNISDSIFVVLLPDKRSELHWINFAIATFIIMSKIQSICIINGLPTRGAISSGDLFYDSNKGIFIGEPIIQAFLWERAQKFSWLSIDPFCSISCKYKSFPKCKGYDLLKKIKLDKILFEKDRLDEYFKYMDKDVKNIEEIEVFLPIDRINLDVKDILLRLNNLGQTNKNHQRYYTNAISIIGND